MTHRRAASVGYADGPLPVVEELERGVFALGGYSGTGNLVGALAGRAAAEWARVRPGRSRSLQRLITRPDMAEFQTTTIELSRTFTKSREAVWEALTDGIVEWWPKDFYIGTYDGIEPVGMEMRPSRRTPRRALAGGEGLLWATVITVHSRLLTLTGDCAPAFGGTNRAFTEYRLEERDGGSELRFSHTPFGVVSEETAGTLGWLGHAARSPGEVVEEGITPNARRRTAAPERGPVPGGADPMDAPRGAHRTTPNDARPLPADQLR